MANWFTYGNKSFFNQTLMCFEEAIKDFLLSDEEGIRTKVIRNNIWIAPLLGWYLANINIVVNSSKVSFSMVFRDHKSEVLFFASKICNLVPLNFTEILAL